MMAVSAELQKQYDAAKANLDAAYEAIKVAANLPLDTRKSGQDAAFQAVQDALKKFNPIKARYDKAKKAEEDSAKKLADDQEKIVEAADTLQKAEAALDNVRFTAFGYKGKSYSKEQLRDELIPQLRQIANSQVSAPSSRVRATAQMRGEGMGPVVTVEEDAPVIDETPPPPPPSNTVVSTQSATSATDQKTFVDSEITKRKLKNTPANREKLRKEFQSKNKPVDDMAWMDEFRKTYAAYSDWTTNEVIDHFGQDFVDILKEAVNTEFTDEEIQARIKGTQYFKSITDSQYKFDGASSAVQNGLLQSARDAIVKDYADVGLAQTDIDEIARKVARNGLTATGVKQAVYQYAFRRPEAATTPTSPAMATRALEGGDADTIRQSARTYGYKVSDAELQAVLTGGMYNGVAVTKDSILQKAQKAAKGAYGHLADQIDAGLSLEDIFSNYRNYAADLLEIDPNQIDFTKDGKWAKAFGSKETGQMSLTDWISTVKSDPSFGWQFTKQANQQATDIGLTLARAFGKVS
jgi:hypothetical protein